MINLIKIEFIKIKKTRLFIASFLSMILSPIISLLIMSIEPKGFVLGDFNKINIVLLSLIGTRTVFPLISMSVIKMGNGIDGIKSSFLTPVSRKKLLLSKIIFAFLWMCILVLFSVCMVIVTELFLFKDMSIMTMVVTSQKDYFLILLYALPLQIIAMMLSILFNNMLVPTLLFVGMIMSGYILQLYNQLPFMPGVIPRYISGNLPEDGYITIAFIFSTLFGVVAYELLGYLVKNKDYIR